MRKKLLICALAGSALLAFAAQDPVLMSINGKDVKLSEFEYLYHKNNQQQLQKETLDQYLDRFIVYKLKVADAEAAKIDTLPTFNSEFAGYKNDIVRPFLEDTTVNVKLVNDAYQRSLKNVDVSHIMIPLGKDFADNKKQEATLDSIRTCILKGQDFGALAQKYSIDRSAKTNKGHLGFIAAGRFPYSFEMQAYNTPVGQISKPFRTQYGLHIVKVNGVRPDRGTVRVRHILKLFPRNATDSAKAAVKDSIEKVYSELMAGKDFAELAKTESQDKGSARTGGELNWFGSGDMVPQFEEAAFALKDNEISKPIETVYGYHIIQKLEQKAPMSLAEATPGIKNQISMDERSQMPREAKLEQIKKAYNYKVNNKFGAYILSELNKHGKYDSTFVANVLAKSDFPIFTYNKVKAPASLLAKRVSPRADIRDNKTAAAYIESAVGDVANDEITKAYSNSLISHNQDYKNLLNEYRDGMLLFEISNRKVWDAASSDTTGLINQFTSNRASYKWDVPHFKGIILMAKNDSVAKAVKADINKFGADTLTTALHRKYQTNIKMERMLVAKGENKMVDYLEFNGEKAASRDNKYPVYFVLQGKVIDQPEDYTDVRGQVTSDYQDLLEKKWDKELKAKYPVVINKEVLKLVK
jgi:peptidyl-prolyl cis-trans isomerase SurA